MITFLIFYYVFTFIMGFGVAFAGHVRPFHYPLYMIFGFIILPVMLGAILVDLL